VPILVPTGNVEDRRRGDVRARGAYGTLFESRPAENGFAGHRSPLALNYSVTAGIIMRRGRKPVERKLWFPLAQNRWAINPVIRAPLLKNLDGKSSGSISDLFTRFLVVSWACPFAIPVD